MLSEKDKKLIAYVHNDVVQNELRILVIGSQKFIKEIVNGVKTEALSQGKHVPEQHINKLTKIYTSCIADVLGVDFLV